MKVSIIGYIPELLEGMAQRLQLGGYAVRVYIDAANKSDIENPEVLDSKLVASISDLWPNSQGNELHVIWLLDNLLLKSNGELHEQLVDHVNKNTIVVDANVKYFKDSIVLSKHVESLSGKYVDVGIINREKGAMNGYGILIGGTTEVVEEVTPLFDVLASSTSGWKHIGKVGAGHYARMVHDAVEYATMKAMSEAFGLMHFRQELELDLPSVANVWELSETFSPELLRFIADTLDFDPQLTTAPKEQNEDMRLMKKTIIESLDLNTPIPVIAAALQDK